MIKERGKVIGKEAAITQENLSTESAGEEKRTSTVGDLVLYLLGGFGLFLVASTLLSLGSSPGTLADLLARYLLNLIFLGGAALFWGLRRKKITWNQLGLALKRWRWSFLGLAILISAVLNPIRAGLAILIQILFGGGMAGLEARNTILTAGGFSWPAFILTLVGVGILVPFSEELYFRGLLYNWLKGRFRFWPSVLLSAALFGLGHFDTVGVMVSAFIMGIVNAWVYERSGSLWFPIAIHAITNSSAVILIFASMLFGIG